MIRSHSPSLWVVSFLVTVDYCLDSGCYATMLIREVTKYETDVKSQLALRFFVCFHIYAVL